MGDKKPTAHHNIDLYLGAYPLCCLESRILHIDYTMALALNDRLALAALIIARVSLLNAFLQLLQQYCTTAEGFKRC